MNASIRVAEVGPRGVATEVSELRLQPTATGDTIIAGSLEFSAQTSGQKFVSDQYEISISIPPGYPRATPLVRDTAAHPAKLS